MVRTVVPGPAPSLITVMWDWIGLRCNSRLLCEEMMFFLDYLITMRTYDTCTSFRVAFIGTVNIMLIAFGSIQTQSTKHSHSHSHIHYGNAFTYTFTLLHDTIRYDTCTSLTCLRIGGASRLAIEENDILCLLRDGCLGEERTHTASRCSRNGHNFTGKVIEMGFDVGIVQFLTAL